MKYYFLLLTFILFAQLVRAQQEFPSETGIFIGTRDLPPALSRLAPLVSEKHFDLTDASFLNRIEKREVNMLGFVEQERRLQENVAVYDTPSFYKERKKGSLQVTDNVHLYNRASNYDYYTGKLKNPVYEDMASPIFNDFYRRHYDRRNPYYSPFLR